MLFSRFREVYFFSLLLGITISFGSKLWAAACCGGGIAAAGLIPGDEGALLSTSFTHSQVVVESVDSAGIWRTSDVRQEVETFRIEAARIFQDRWQAGLSVPMIQRSRAGVKSSGVGDLATNLGYEYLPDWDYNPWRPRGLGYLQVILPTGRSRAESELGGLDSRGNGFWSLGLGTLLTKAWGLWDGAISLELHQSFAKRVHTATFDGDVLPGRGGSFSIGAGHSFHGLRLGANLVWSYEDPINMKPAYAVEEPGSAERYATASVSASLDLGEEWSANLTVADQTLFGSPVNTSLGRSVALSLQRRWGRE